MSPDSGGSTFDLSHSLDHSNPHPLPNHYRHWAVILEEHFLYLPALRSHLGMPIKNIHPQAPPWKLWAGA